MEKTAQNPSGATRRRRRRRGSGTGASQSAAAQSATARESGKTAQPAAKEKPARPQPARKEGKETAQPGQNTRGRHRGAQQPEPQAQQVSSSRRSHGNGGQAAPSREQNHPAKASTRAARAPRRAAEEDPGLELITRRPPKQKFANFEEYLAAHGGMTVPLPPEQEDPSAPQPDAAGAAE